MFPRGGSLQAFFAEKAKSGVYLSVLDLRNSDYRGTASLQSAKERLETLSDYLGTDEYKQ